MNREAPHAIPAEDLRDLDNVPASEPIDEDLLEEFRDANAARLGRVDAIPTVSSTVALDDSNPESYKESGLTESSEPIYGMKPDWLALAVHPHIAGPSLPKSLDRRALSPRLFGSDYRVIVWPKQYPYSCICHIATSYRKAGSTGPWSSYVLPVTGVMVGERVLLTTSDAVTWQFNPSTGYEWMMEIVPAFWDGSSVFGPQVKTYGAEVYGWKEGSLPGRGGSAHVPSRNLTIVRTYDPIGKIVGTMGINIDPSGTLAQPIQEYVTGYSLDYEQNKPKTEYSPGVQIGTKDYTATGSLPNGVAAESYCMQSQADGDYSTHGGPFWSYYATGSGVQPMIRGIFGDDWGSGGQLLGNYIVSGPLVRELVDWARSSWP